MFLTTQGLQKLYQTYQGLLLRTQAEHLDIHDVDILAPGSENLQDGQEHCVHLESQQEVLGPLWDNRLSVHRAYRRVSVLFQVLL